MSKKRLCVEGIFESRLAPLIDRVMADNIGVYIKSHPLQSENKLGIELHLTIIADQDCKPDELLLRAAKQLASLVGANGGRTLAGK